MSVAEIIRFHPVSALLATSGQPTEAQLADAAAEGFELVINLALHDDPRYSLADEPGCVSALGMDYIHIPVPFAAPGLEHLKRFIEAMQQSQGRKTLVHCAHNKRVPVFLALYRILVERWDTEDARNAMLKAWTPDEIWLSFLEAHCA